MTANTNVVIFYNQVTQDSPKDELDVLAQVEVVSRALKDLGYHPIELGFSISLSDAINTLKECNPLLVFNLTESLLGDGRLIHFAGSLLDHLGIPYTGCSTEAMFLTSNKMLTKKLLDLAGIATPQWITINNSRSPRELPSGNYIIKSAWEHASNWFNEDSVIALESGSGRSAETKAREILNARMRQTGKEFFAERYIDGREFNLSVLAGEVLAVPEIKFVDYAEDKLKVVDFKAKWEENSFEFHHTPRCFDFPESDHELLENLRRISRQCWDLFELRGYARVDFRVDSEGQPWVLEINANPCISADSGFYAAAEKSGLPFTRVVERIIKDTLG